MNFNLNNWQTIFREGFEVISKKNSNNETNKPGEKASTGSEKQYERIQNIGSVITSSSKRKIY